MSAAMKLEVFHEGQLVQEIPVSEQEFWVGRDQGCVVRLEDRAISRRHALLKATAKGIEFEKKSKFGWVKVNGKETTQTMLKNGDLVEMGPFEIRVMGAVASSTFDSNTEESSEKSHSIAEAAVESIQPPSQGEILASDSAGAQPASQDFVMAMPDLDAQSEGAISSEGIPGQVSQASIPGVEALNPPESGTVNVEVPADAPALGLDPLENQNTQSVDLMAASNDAQTRVFNTQEQTKAILQFNNGEANVTQFEITESEIAIGRSQQCHIVLEDKRSSRKHSLIRKEGSKYFLKDLGSANGTLLNGVRVDDAELQSGDKIQIGETVFQFMVVQADYEIKKAEFISVPEQEMAQAAIPGVTPIQQDYLAPPVLESVATPGTDQFLESPEEKKWYSSSLLERYRAMSTRRQIMWGLMILGLVWYIMEDDPVNTPARLNTGAQQKQAVQKQEKKVGEGRRFETLTPEEQRYIETQYQLAFDLYKNREYDKSLLEIGRIFGLVQDYKNAREIEAFAREGKRKLEAQEDERKRKEAERQAQLQLQSLLEQAGMLMEKKRFKEAEALFPEIELIQPENLAVNEWRKLIIAEGERLELERQEKERMEKLLTRAWRRFESVKQYRADHDYQVALDGLQEIRDLQIIDRKLNAAVESEEREIRQAIAAEREPLLQQGRDAEQSGQLAEAFKAYERANELDPDDVTAKKGMDRIRGTLTARAKAMYIEAVFAESYNDLETAERGYREILKFVPKGNEYAVKSESRLKKITSFRKPASGESQ